MFKKRFHIKILGFIKISFIIYINSITYKVVKNIYLGSTLFKNLSLKIYKFF